MKTLLFFIFFLLIGAFFIISNENIKMNSNENIDYFISQYSKWFDKLINNGNGLAGYVIKMQWLPDSK